MPTRPLGAQISHMLKDRGVSTIFGIPGVHNQEMYRGIEEAGITHILARHEQGAGFMADGYARATGRPGVAYVISGPGLCNIMTPMGQAYSDSVPMLVLSSVLDETEATRGQLHQMKDQEAAAATVCDWSVTAKTADAAFSLIDRALAEFQTRRMRPKHIQVPISVLEAQAPEAPSASEWPIGAVGEADPLRLEALREWLRASKRPLFIFGGGATRDLNVILGAQTGGDQVSRMVQDMGAAVMTTYAGRGRISPNYALNFGSMLARPESADVISTADLVIAVGTELSEVDLWRDALGHTAKLVRIDLDPEVLTDRHKADMVIHASAYGHLLATLTTMTKEPPKTGWDPAEVASFKSRMRAQINAERPGILPVVDVLKEALPDDTMIFSDMTQFAYAAKEVYPLDRPNHWHHPYGFGTLGYALPAAIGGKVGVGEQPVLAILGDYGFQYTVQELAVAVELGQNLPIIIWDNGKLGEIEDSMVRAQIAPNAVIQRNPDFLKLAEAYGAAATEPESLGDLAPALYAAFSRNVPTVIRLRSDIALTSS
ncbi:thiamine pyrophosphate-binding protein [Yoonia litorea]|uniref:Acetolactate synthase-1/2/3 large subunit/5-guanidino-2-oxopentanoate decarboxylase n=1 Tax=Yoonia litorea TaxID=1123755 RepID=A0A1I6MES8_9RHOB|nr:thiamine pyrophosphate-binding protein [Yoonia litorea]SFS14226.1 acetolactate synthase-1/2/3 large subunit/5-guanidino-2-oxopentanoate decarboxylase [Yoonia litorea]